MAASKPNASDTLLAVGVEGIAVALFTLLAGANDQIGSFVLMFMVGMWILFLVTNGNAVSRITNTVGNISKL